MGQKKKQHWWPESTTSIKMIDTIERLIERPSPQWDAAVVPACHTDADQAAGGTPAATFIG